MTVKLLMKHAKVTEIRIRKKKRSLSANMALRIGKFTKTSIQLGQDFSKVWIDEKLCIQKKQRILIKDSFIGKNFS